MVNGGCSGSPFIFALISVNADKALIIHEAIKNKSLSLERLCRNVIARERSDRSNLIMH